MNINYPPNLDAYFEILGFCQADFLPNSFEYLIEENSLEDQDAPERYDDLDINTNFLLNAGNMI